MAISSSILMTFEAGLSVMDFIEFVFLSLIESTNASSELTLMRGDFFEAKPWSLPKWDFF